MPRIFCCYRRDDSTHQAGRIFDHLATRFGKSSLFRDVDSMPLGRDFRKVLSEQVARCDVLLAIIGDHWLSATEPNAGGRRLDQPGDFVRIELESALHRNIPVIPVLVGHSQIPQPEELPECLRELAFRQGLAVRADPDFHHDVERLIRGISEVLGAAAPKSGPVGGLGAHTRTYLLEKVLRATPAIIPEAFRETSPEPPESAAAQNTAPQNTGGKSRAPSTAAAPPPASSAAVKDVAPAPRRRRLLWAAAVLSVVIVGTVLAVVASKRHSAAADEAMAEARRIEVIREVDSVRRGPPDLLRTQDSLEWEEALPPVDYSAFEILKDERVVDLREWKPVPPERATQLVSASSMIRRLLLRKIHPADNMRFEFRTTGVQLCVSCTSHPSFRVIGQKEEGVVGDKRTKVRQMIVDVHDVPLNREFTVQLLATYWNSLQKEDELWFGAMGYPNSSRVSLLVVFPEDKIFTDYRLMVAPMRLGKPVPFQGRKILLAAENRDWLYWEIPDSQAGQVYSLYWSW